MSILISGSGGGPRGAFIGTAAVEVAKQTKFNYFVGVSYSSIIGVPLCLGMYDEIINETLDLKHNTFFKVSPMNKKGGFSFMAVLRLIASIFAPKKINSFGVQDVKPILKRFVTKELFSIYQNGDFPACYIAAVNAETQKPTIWNVKNKNISYEKYLKIVSASSRIPIWTQPEEIDGVLYYDGGVTDINAGSLVIDMNKDVKTVFSIYARPKGFRGKLAPKIRGIIGAIFWTIDTMLKDVSKNDEIIERNLCKDRKIKLFQIFPPKYVLTNLYDVDRGRLLQLAEMAKQEVKKVFIKNGFKH
jgi:predicted patatin/cPLA2 family phospholipase